MLKIVKWKLKVIPWATLKNKNKSNILKRQEKGATQV